MFSPELQSAVRTIDTADGNKTLVSASTFNRVARAVRNMSIAGGTIGMNPAGGIHLQLIPAVSSGGGGGTYSGPFAMSATGVAAGRALLFGDGGNQFVDFPATAYADMYNRYSATSGIVWADLYKNNGTWTYFYFILPSNQDPGFYDNEFFWPVGTIDLNAGTYEQWHFGDQIFTLSSGGGEYNGPWKLEYISGANAVQITGSTAIYAGTTTIYPSTTYVTYTSGTVYVILTVGLNAAGTGLVASIAGANSPTLTQTDTQYQVCLGYYDGTKIEQWQYGEIYIAGRAV